MTKEEKKEKRRLAQKRYYDKNKKKFSVYAKDWKENNKDKYSDYQKDWYRNNREELKRKEENKSLSHYVIYCLPNEDNYAGKTNNPHRRMIQHKSNGRNTEGWFILEVVKDNEDAFIVERKYHNLGYSGINNNYKKNRI